MSSATVCIVQTILTITIPVLLTLLVLLPPSVPRRRRLLLALLRAMAATAGDPLEKFFASYELLPEDERPKPLRRKGCGFRFGVRSLVLSGSGL